MSSIRSTRLQRGRKTALSLSRSASRPRRRRKTSIREASENTPRMLDCFLLVVTLFGNHTLLLSLPLHSQNKLFFTSKWSSFSPLRVTFSPKTSSLSRYLSYKSIPSAASFRACLAWLCDSWFAL